MARSARRPASDPKVAIVYLRCSTEQQDLSPDAQRAAVERWASAHGVTVAASHDDIGVSGGAELDRRPGLLAALDSLKAHGAGVLLVAKRDRLARDVFNAAMIERLAEKSGARILSADGTGNEATPEAQMLRGIIDVFAQYERALIRSRTRAALAVKRSRGEWTGGDVPYGYTLAADGVHLEPHPVEAAVVAQIREARAAGRSLRSIASDLAAKGITPRGGGRWHPQSVANVVRAA